MQRTILDLVEYVVFEFRPDGELRPRNQAAAKLLAKLAAHHNPCVALFNVNTFAELLELSESTREFHADLALRGGKSLRLKWQLLRGETPDGPTLDCISANWDPVLDLMETFQKESLLFKELVLNIMPQHIAGELINTRAVRPRAYRDCTIMFTDVVRFSKLAYHIEPVTLVRKLNAYFSAYDTIMDRYGLEKIKTIGDSYMCASGLPRKKDSHAIDAALASLELMQLMLDRPNQPRLVDDMDLNNWDIRMGLHSGPCISGVVGHKKYFFDIWGHSVNVASRMESASEPGRINISESTWQQIEDYFEGTFRGSQEVRNIGQIRMYYLDRLKPEFSADEAGTAPNEAFYEAYCERFRLTAASRSLKLHPHGVQEFLLGELAT
ncbi:MAG: adenylate/guanylate cyclase domain-containing protein [Alphaproteobacteria bacterium]|nr:adenylate/guanylate cyclase domain-containing protein [Alphaproteobacteria bacterium]